LNQDDDDGRGESSSSSRIDPDPEKTPADLEYLIGWADGKFDDDMHGRVADAVEVYGLEWVQFAVCGGVKLRTWAGVLKTLANWKREGGPDKATRERARQALQPTAPAAAIPPMPAPAKIIPMPALAPRETPEQREADDRALIAQCREGGVEFRPDEATGKWEAVATRPDARPLRDTIGEYAARQPGVCKILDRERAATAGDNAPCEPPVEPAVPEPPRRASRRPTAAGSGSHSGNGRPTTKDKPRHDAASANGATGSAAAGRILERLRRRRAQGDVSIGGDSFSHQNGKPRKERP
jgi:hypothetical protein